MVAPPTPAGVKQRQIPNGLLRGTRSPGPWQPSLEVAGNVCLDSVADGRDGPGQSHRPGGVVAGNGPFPARPHERRLCRVALGSRASCNRMSATAASKLFGLPGNQGPIGVP
jgi:hypothetical protein